MARDTKNGPIVPDTLANGQEIKLMVSENSFTQMEISTKENG